MAKKPGDSFIQDKIKAAESALSGSIYDGDFYSLEYAIRRRKEIEDLTRRVKESMRSSSGYYFSTPVSYSYDTITLVDPVIATPKEPEIPIVPKTPSAIVKELDKAVIGQDYAKRTLAMAAYYHYFRVEKSKAKFKKSNICLIGPTGTGKTYLLENLAKVMDVPFTMVDATELTPDGYVGRDVGAFVTEIQAKKGQKKEHAIVFIDEADKLSTKHGSNGYKTQEIQQALLKLIEGKMAGKAERYGGETKVDTTKMLFVIGGAFSGITHKKDYKGIITTEDLIKYGLMPEFAGRFPITATLEALKVSDLAKILSDASDNIIDEFKTIFKEHGATLNITDLAINQMAKIAHKFNTGARALRAVVESALAEHLFTLPEKGEGQVINITDLAA